MNKHKRKKRKMKGMSGGPNPISSTPPIPIPPPVEQGTLGLMYLVPSYQQEPAPNVGSLPGITNEFMQGLLLRETWERLERTEGGGLNFDWLDTSIATCQSNNKLVAFQHEPGINSPQWFYDTFPSEILHLTEPSALLTPVSFGPNFKIRWQAVQEALHTRYGDDIAYHIIQGVGRASETFLVSPADETALNTLAISLGYFDYRTAWKAGVRWQIDMMAQVWGPNFIVLTTGAPYTTGGQADLQEMFDYGDVTYQGQFGARANNLSSRGPRPSDPSALIIGQLSPHCVATGFQFANSQITNDPNPPNRLGLALDKGISFGAHFIEMFANDADDPRSAPVLASAVARLT